MQRNQQQEVLLRTPERMLSTDERASFDDQHPPLLAFKGFLFNDGESRSSLSNAIAFWDLLPKFANEGLNEQMPRPYVAERWFTYGGKNYRFTQFPGSTRDHRYENDDTALWVFRFPGIREQCVELALLKLASEAGGVCEKGEGASVSYGVVFSIRQLRSVLEQMGHTYSHKQIVEALDILTSSNFVLESESDKKASRHHILTEYQAASATGGARNSPEARWRVFFHRIVAQAIENAQYRQFDLARLHSRRSCGIALMKRLLFTTNLAPEYPLEVRFSEIQATSSGLVRARLRDAISDLEKEIKRMVTDGVLADYEKEPEYGSQKGRGRPPLVDAVFTLYPSTALVGEIKRANKRQTLSEQTLQLSPRLRKERQLALALEVIETEAGDQPAEPRANAALRNHAELKLLP